MWTPWRFVYIWKETYSSLDIKLIFSTEPFCLGRHFSPLMQSCRLLLKRAALDQVERGRIKGKMSKTYQGVSNKVISGVVRQQPQIFVALAVWVRLFLGLVKRTILHVGGDRCHQNIPVGTSGSVAIAA